MAKALTNATVKHVHECADALMATAHVLGAAANHAWKVAKAAKALAEPGRERDAIIGMLAVAAKDLYSAENEVFNQRQNKTFALATGYTQDAFANNIVKAERVGVAPAFDIPRRHRHYEKKQASSAEVKLITEDDIAKLLSDGSED